MACVKKWRKDKMTNKPPGTNLDFGAQFLTLQSHQLIRENDPGQLLQNMQAIYGCSLSVDAKIFTCRESPPSIAASMRPSGLRAKRHWATMVWGDKGWVALQ